MGARGMTMNYSRLDPPLDWSGPVYVFRDMDALVSIAAKRIIGTQEFHRVEVSANIFKSFAHLGREIVIPARFKKAPCIQWEWHGDECSRQVNWR